MVYFDAYNALAAGKTLAAGELASDGYTAAYTEIKSGASSNLTGPCVCSSAAGCNAYDDNPTGAASGSDYDNDLESTLGFNGSASTDAGIGADGAAAAALSVCAKKCSAKLHWLLATSNLPYTMLADSGNNNILTTSDAAAVTASTTVMTNA